MSGTTNGGGNASISVIGTGLGTPLQAVLMTDDIAPGSEASYEICKILYLYHPLGLKMAEAPVTMAQSQQREIAIPDAPEDMVREQFEREWKNLNADRVIFNVMRTARIYGISSVVLGAVGTDPSEPLDFATLARQEIFFNVYDPLNTAGSLVLNQEPNSPDFQKVVSVAVSGVAYHRSRAVVMMNEEPIYLAFTGSAYGYVGRSVYQRALYPLKSFIQTMITDDMVSRKAGVIVAKMKAPGSIIDQLMVNIAGIKRDLLKQARTDNVLGVGHEDVIESLNLQNIDGPMTVARKNILENIATASDMPAKLLNQETFAEGFGEGTEDAKAIVRYVDRMREQMRPLYAFMDRVTQHRAWNQEFYKTVQAKFPDEYGSMPYRQAFYRWQNSFEAEWPSLMTEPESEKIKVEETKLKAVVDLIKEIKDMCDPESKGKLLQWAADNFNENKRLFPSPLVLDWEAIGQYEPPPPPGMDGEEGGEDKAPPAKKEAA